MSWYAAVPPRLGTVDGAGWCLRFAQSFFGAPAMYESAWQAWLATYETTRAPPSSGASLFLGRSRWIPESIILCHRQRSLKRRAHAAAPTWAAAGTSASASAASSTLRVDGATGALSYLGATVGANFWVTAFWPAKTP